MGPGLTPILMIMSSSKFVILPKIAVILPLLTIRTRMILRSPRLIHSLPLACWEIALTSTCMVTSQQLCQKTGMTDGTHNGQEYICFFGLWLDTDTGYSNSKTVTCEENGISEIRTKTDSRAYANTDDNVFIKVCDTPTNCCESPSLDNEDKNDFEKSQVDTFTGAALMGSCNNINLHGRLMVTLSKDGDDGWYPEETEIVLKDGKHVTCKFGLWLDSETGYSNSKTVCQCEERAMTIPSE